ncbi:MAG: DUF2851 family protein [Bacteroidales bacterium]
MNEDFLAYVWQFRLYSGIPKLTTGDALAVEQPGTLNRDSGPDFLGALIRIDDTLWAGHVEIHMKSSDWNLHGHQNDPAYENVVLHVVYQHDKEVLRPDQTSLPVLELRYYIDSSLYTRYLQFMASPREVACENFLKGIPLTLPSQWLVSLGLQRLIRKGLALDYLAQRLGNDWNETLYVSFCKGFGNKVNDDVFEMLALKTPLKLVRNLSEDSTALEALLFGQSGLLPEGSGWADDTYVSAMQDRYASLLYKYRCEPLEKHLWRFLRTRPANFPTVRIAQLAALLGSFLSINPLMMDELRNWMEYAGNITVSKYWQEHYHFGRPCSGLPGSIGRESLERIIINGIIPPLVRYGEIYRSHDFIASLVDELAGFAPENNKVIRTWKSLGVIPGSAVESQGLMELFNEYCRGKRCLECRFGHQVLATTLI